MPRNQYGIHPIALEYPELPPEEFEALVADVRQHGLLRPITLWENQVIDGRHRYRACTEAGVEPVFVEFEGENPREYVWSLNAQRRSLTTGQRLGVFLSRTDVRERLRLDLTRSELNTARHSREYTAPRPEGYTGKQPAQAWVADQCGVGTSNASQATAIARTHPEVLPRLVSGEWTVNEARKQTGRRPSGTSAAARQKGREEVLAEVADTAFQKAGEVHEEDGEPVVEVSGFSEHRITSLDQLFDFFKIPFRWLHGTDCKCNECDCKDNRCGRAEICPDRIPVSDDYEVISFKVNSWEQHSVRKGVVTLYQVKASLRPRDALESQAAIDAMFDEFCEMIANHGPDDSVLPVPLGRERTDDTGQLMEICLVDPHLGMLAWGKEVQNAYDLDIGLADYKRAFVELLEYASHYNIDEVLLHVGHDLFHVDGTLEGGKGATTTKGTQQDFDTRLARLFVHVEQLIVDCIEECAIRFPKVTVQMTPGNHDRHTVYKLGRVLDAWFRQVERVEIRNSPSVRSYWGYGGNVFMFTHGEEFKRNRDNLATIFATECPPELWIQGKVREIHVGHNHINMQKVWDGKSVEEVWEGRAIRARSLPGLTPEDAWHFEQGYKHQRRGTVMVWHRRGGLAGLHEVTL